MVSQVPAVIAKIISQQQKYTYGENQIANFVIHNSEFITRHTITALANEIGVSETSINRFCKKVGFKGFNDFKIAVAQDSFYREMQTRKKERRDIDPIDALALDYNELIVNTAAMVSEPELSKLAGQLKAARRIHIFGIFDSFLAAAALKNRLSLLGIQAEAVGDSRAMKIAAVHCGEDDLVIAFTRSGSTGEIIEAMTAAHANRAMTAAITCYESSPVTETVQTSIIVPDKMSVSSSAMMANHMTFLFVIDAMMSLLIASDKAYLKTKLDSEGLLTGRPTVRDYY
ncbi:MurR/RpiR family transcriptional regulator [Saccharibacillus sp. CPCC 101409]|uniref:MurR/RpiR family transcriptional regulator n=1 Tax=Saccharibacillus sp. CPCC 101409 TaxID=3058041 RepID=UPI002672F9FA|nr:MurR/RpiR family transcriptional regulator [Saccharibacillus sp. CPCC 101409]MDO3408448.1 MurR/RpiR family transcriptional regulator [Saccharibacillus sp. CPCC 101409]